MHKENKEVDKKHDLSLRFALFFPFRCFLVKSLEFSSSTVKQTKLFKFNTLQFPRCFSLFYEENSSRKTFLVECLRRNLLSEGAASFKRL